SRYIAECLAAQSTTNLAELRSLGVRELRPTLQLASQDLVLSGEIFIQQQQLLVHRPADVGQDACPLHELPHLPAGSQSAPLIAPKNVPENARRAHVEWHNCPILLAVRIFWPYGCWQPAACVRLRDWLGSASRPPVRRLPASGSGFAIPCWFAMATVWCCRRA